MPKYAIHKDTQSLRVSSKQRQRVMIQKYDFENGAGNIEVRYLTTIMEWDPKNDIYVATHQTETDYASIEDNTYYSKKNKCVCGVEY